jgi:hypothetical protein
MSARLTHASIGSVHIEDPMRSLNRWLVWLSALARYHHARSRLQLACDESALIRAPHESALIACKLADVFAVTRPQGGVARFREGRGAA